MILAGDIGGTSTRLAAFDVGGDKPRLTAEKTYPSAKYSGLGEIVGQFVAEHGLQLSYACCGIAGPVQDGRVKTTNLPWMIEGAALARQFGLPAFALINDLEANAWGVAALGPEDLLTLNPGAPNAHGNTAVIAAGTGLGEAGMYWDGSEHRPFACEGGHVDFAPRSDLEIELLQYLIKKFGRVSYERVVSGMGLGNIYEFLLASGRGPEVPEVAAAMQGKDLAAEITRAAQERRSPVCTLALDLFVSIYGAEAGNVVLKFMALGGLYIGGGIAPKILDKLKDGTFMRAYLAKGRMQPLCEATPVRVILNPNTALLGAARYAARELRLRAPR